MSINAAIARDIKCYPTLFGCRTDVLHQWFCVNGNGMEWRGGRLVHRSDSPVPSLASVLAEATHHARKRLHEQDLATHQLARLRVQIAKMESEVTFRYENADDLTLVPWDSVLNGTQTTKSDFAPQAIYPLCEFARMNSVPDDVDPEYLAAVREMICEVFDSSQASTHWQASEQERARAREANCVFADRVLQDLARRFPEGNPFLSRADRDTKRAVAWGKVSQALKRVRG